MAPSVGIVLPHFGEIATVERVLGAARSMEEAGLESVWVRDHLFFTPHDYEPTGTRFLDPFSTLSAVAVSTRHLRLGTATLVPFRHPLVVSQLLGTIDALAGGGRLIVGVGAGGVPEPFVATGQPFDRRFKMVDEWMAALRATWESADALYSGTFFDFSHVTIDPRPSPSTPIWYGGASESSIRRAARLADGWLPGRCPLKVLDRLLPYLETQTEEHGRTLSIGIMPLLAIGDSRESALASVDIDGLLQTASHNPVWRESFDEQKDLDGMLIAGRADDCVEQAMALVSRGVEHLVFDFRLCADAIDEQLNRFAEEVLPRLQAGDDAWRT